MQNSIRSRRRPWTGRISCALAAALLFPACTQVITGGNVHEDDAAHTSLPGVIVTYTSMTTGVTFNDTTRDPSGEYQIFLPEDTYLIQAVHPTCNAVPPTHTLTVREEFSPYTYNIVMTCP